MKKFILFLTIGLASLASKAQTSLGNMTATNGLSLDTVTNTGTKNLFIGTTGKAKATAHMAFVLTVTKISGTVGGTATLQGSHNGTDWAGIVTAYTITDGTQTKALEYDKGDDYTYYRINVVGTGTMSASIKATYKYQ